MITSEALSSLSSLDKVYNKGRAVAICGVLSAQAIPFVLQHWHDAHFVIVGLLFAQPS